MNELGNNNQIQQIEESTSGIDIQQKDQLEEMSNR